MEFNEEEYEGLQENAEEVLGDVEEEIAQDMEEAQHLEEVWHEAMERIEQANLYKLLIKSDVFDAGSASPNILTTVNREVRQFALDKLEELLGMKAPERQQEQAQQQIELPFDGEEVKAIKLLAAKMLKRDMKPVLSSDYEPSINKIKTDDTQEKPKTSKPLESRTPKLKKKSPPSNKQKTKASKKPKRTHSKNTGSQSKPKKQHNQQQEEKLQQNNNKGYTVPKNPSKKLRQPTADELASKLTTADPGMSITHNQNDGDLVNSGSQQTLKGIVSQLTGGHVVHQDTGTPEDTEDINGRF